MKSNINIEVSDAEKDVITVKGVKLKGDFLDADMMEKWEGVLQYVKNYKNDSSKPIHEQMRNQCNIVFDAFDELFGDGTSNAIFGAKTNLRECIEAFDELERQASAQQEAFNDYIGNMKTKKTGNRAIRRNVISINEQ